MAAPKIVLVTGCSAGGIGFALCEEFASRGCKVYATSRRIEAMDGFSNPGIERRVLDVTSEADVQNVVHDILENEGRIDIVVNNAGIHAVGPLADMPLDQVQRTFDTNVFSLLRVARAVIPFMAQRKRGLIVNIGSIAGDIPTPWVGIYCASKAAVKTLSDVLSMECRPFNIDVMLVTPGAVKSNISKNHAPTFALPSDSLYSAYVDNMIERMHASETLNTMPTKSFASQVVAKVLMVPPATHLTVGGGTLLFYILGWLPKQWVMSLVWKRLSRKH